MPNKDYKRSLNNIMDVLVPAVGVIIICAAIWILLKTNDIALGGAPGIALILEHLFKFNFGLSWFAINVPLFTIAWFLLGKKFTISTAIVVGACYLISDYVVVKIPQLTIDPILASVFGGIIMGFGIGLVFTRGFTTGGTDIVGRLIQLRFTHLSIGRLMLIVDFCIITAYAIALQKPSAAFYGLITIFCSTKTIDFVLYGSSNNKMFYIISDKYKEIAEYLNTSLNQRITFLDGQGGPSQSMKKIIVCVTMPSEFYKVKNAIYELDDNAFVIITDSSDVFGSGFKQMKTSMLNR